MLLGIAITRAHTNNGQQAKPEAGQFPAIGLFAEQQEGGGQRQQQGQPLGHVAAHDAGLAHRAGQHQEDTWQRHSQP